MALFARKINDIHCIQCYRAIISFSKSKERSARGSDLRLLLC